MADEDYLAERAAQLGFAPSGPANDEQLARVRVLSDVAIPSLYRLLQLQFGECKCNCAIHSDELGTKDVIFFGIAEIERRLEELQGKRLLPFADDLWGNVFYLDARGGGEPSVVLFDDELEEFMPVEDTFAAFIGRLEMRR
jgi:hypothetical protein